MIVVTAIAISSVSAAVMAMMRVSSFFIVVDTLFVYKYCRNC